MSDTAPHLTVFDLAADLTLADAARLLICGSLPPEDCPPRIPVDDLPCYQVLSAAGVADGQHPWLRLASVTPTDVRTGEESGLSPEDEQKIADILGKTDWLLLLVGDTAESLAIAVAVGRFALSRGLYVNAFVPGNLSIAPADRDALLSSVSFLCRCPGGVSPLLAAETLWASVMYQGIVGIDYGDLRGNLVGEGQLLWAPMRQDGPGRIRGLFTQLDDFAPHDMIWAVLVMPSSLSLEEFTEVGEHVSQYCHEQTSVVIALPETEVLPNGLSLFVQ